MNSLRVIFRPAALTDIEALFDYLLERAGSEVAKRFFDAAFASADRLADFPSRGTPARFAWARRRRLRSWPVRGFPAVRLLYRSHADRVEVVRVLDIRRSLSRPPNT